MTELKTLKDLQKDLEWPYDTLKGLKAEAIKWVKSVGVIGIDAFETKQDWIKYFFNLTSEEIK